MHVRTLGNVVVSFGKVLVLGVTRHAYHLDQLRAQLTLQGRCVSRGWSQPNPRVLPIHSSGVKFPNFCLSPVNVLSQMAWTPRGVMGFVRLRMMSGLNSEVSDEHKHGCLDALALTLGFSPEYSLLDVQKVVRFLKEPGPSLRGRS